MLRVNFYGGLEGRIVTEQDTLRALREIACTIDENRHPLK